MIKRSALLSLVLFGSATPALAAADGKALFDSNCSVCHQAEGVGSPGQFPPLKGRIDKIAGTKEGKAYLENVVLNGLSGMITVQGSMYMGFMPSFKTMGDDELAAVLSYLSSLGATKPAPAFTADEVKAARATPKKAADLQAERKALDAAHPMP